MNFPDLTKDPADVVTYTMDWTTRLTALPGSPQIAAITSINVNGDCTVSDKTGTYPASVLKLQVAGGSGFGWTGDPQISNLSIVTVLVELTDGSALSRSFNVKELML